MTVAMRLEWISYPSMYMSVVVCFSSYYYNILVRKVYHVVAICSISLVVGEFYKSMRPIYYERDILYTRYRVYFFVLVGDILKLNQTYKNKNEWWQRHYFLHYLTSWWLNNIAFNPSIITIKKNNTSLYWRFKNAIIGL